MLRRISPISWVLIVIGVLLVIVGVIYFTTGPLDLPSFIPGAVKHAANGRKYDQKYSKRGIAAIVLALAAFAGVYYKDLRA
jgi:hypothetical protein